MPKRKRLLTPLKNKVKQRLFQEGEKDFKISDDGDKEVSVARGRLKGALMDVLEPMGEDSDTFVEQSTKRERFNSNDNQRESVEDKELKRKSPPRQSYVLKLFDRSVDLSQFHEDSPLYPICRAWMINQPKANYKEYGQTYEEPEVTKDSVELPGPEGPPVSKIPELLPEQKERSKNNINLNYRSAGLPSREELLCEHAVRWANVRQAWREQAHLFEARYEASQILLNKINVNAM